MDLHPMIVHFPIALLTLYAIFEILPVARWYGKLPWTAIKTILVVTGALGALAAVITGGLAEETITNPAQRQVVELHENFAVTTAIIFGILAVARLKKWIRTEHPLFMAVRYPSAVATGDAIINFFLSTPVRILLALTGLAAITVTGALGGAMVHGPNIDPAVKFIYGLFF